MLVQPGSSYQNEHIFLFSQSCAKLKVTVERVFNNFPRLAPGARFTASSDWFLTVFRGVVWLVITLIFAGHVMFLFPTLQ